MTPKRAKPYKDEVCGPVDLGKWFYNRKVAARTGTPRDIELMPEIADALRIDRAKWDEMWRGMEYIYKYKMGPICQLFMQIY